MKRIKKPVSILLSLIMVFSMFAIVPLSASAAVAKVTSEPADWSGVYYIMNSNDCVFDGSLTALDANNNFDPFCENDNTFTIEAVDGGYSIKSASGLYIGNNKNSNLLQTSSDTPFVNTITMDPGADDGSVLITAAEGGTVLRYNTSNQRFRYYKSSSYTSQQPVYLYKVVEEEEVTYTGLMNNKTVVKFNNHDWYIIADDSSSATAGTVTLLAADNSFGTSKFDGEEPYSNAYSNSTVKGVLDALTAPGGEFAAVKDAIADTPLTDVGVSGAKLYLLSSSEALPYVELSFNGAEYGGWWLRSNGDASRALVVYGDFGMFNNLGEYVYKEYGVRPALKLDLSKVEFNSETKTFAAAAPATNEPNNGTNITVADTISENFYIDGDYYGADAYVTVNYNHNSNLSQTANFNTDDPQKLSEMDKVSGGDYAGNSIISVIQAPAQSTEPITINVYASQADAEAGTNPVDTITYSVYTYCRDIIEGEYEEDLKDLARATLDYAAAAQNYFEYNQSNMATKDNASNAYYGDVAGVDFDGVAGVSSLATGIESFTVVVKSDLEINLLSRTPINVTSASIDTTGTSRFAAENTTNGDWYVVHIKGIEPANMDNTFTVVTDKGNIEMSANAIMKLMANSDDEKLVTLAKAMYLYGAAADTYFANQNA